MTTSRDELRNHLVAVIEAARELPPDSREQLADGFLDEMNRQFDLVPRGSGARRSRPAMRDLNAWLPQMRGWPLLAGVVGLLLLLPLLLFTGFLLLHLVPFALPLLLFVFVFHPGRGRNHFHHHTWR